LNALVGFALRRVRGSLWQFLWTHVLTSVTMAMTLFVFGAFMLLQLNLERLLKGWGDQLEVTAYLNRGTGTAEVQSLLTRLQTYPEVERVRHINQEQAWRDFQTALGAQSGLMEGLPRDVLPTSVEITLKSTYRNGPSVEQLAKRLQQEKEISVVEYPQDWVERLGVMVLGVQSVKWIVGGILFLVTFFIVSSTVKLAILARQQEIEVMQLVGASEPLIQAPYVIEGTLQGLIGAAVSIGALWGAYLLLRDELSGAGRLLAPMGQLDFLDPASVALMLTIGWLLGAAASLFALRRFVRSWKVCRTER
jgi:cell division transport system permease protein